MTKKPQYPASHLRSEYKDATNLRQRYSLHDRFSTNPKGWFEWVFDQLECGDQARILEIGCGPALLWQRNAHRVKPGWDLYLSDFSAGMVAEARKQIPTLRIQLFLSADAQALPFPETFFDAVIANHMLYHVPDVHRAVEDIRRVLRPGARLYAATNGKRHLMEMAQFVSAAKSEKGDETAQAFRMSISGFDLENGAKILGRRFSAVETRHYQDSLSVTDPSAIVHYIQSSPTLRLSPNSLAHFQHLLHRHLQSHGAITITKELGLFVATRSSGA